MNKLKQIALCCFVLGCFGLSLNAQTTKKVNSEKVKEPQTIVKNEAKILSTADENKLKEAEIKTVEKRKANGTYRHKSTKWYKGDFSPKAVAYLQSLGYPEFKDTGNPEQDQIDYKAAVQSWQLTHQEDIQVIQQQVEELNQNAKTN